MAFEPRSPTFAKYGGEHQPLLDYKDTVVGIPGTLEIPDEAEPHVVEELKTLLKLVYPVVVTTALEFLPGFTCIILAGHIKSSHTQQYVDAATLSTMFMNITAYSIGFGLTSALDTLCSQAYGAKRFGKIGIYFQAGLQIIVACLGPVFLLNWYSESFLLFMGQDPEVSRLAQTFSRWTLPGVPFVFLYELVRKVLQAQNIMKPLVTIAAIGNVVNIVSGIWLTYHTSMGFEGIALSRSLGNIVLPLLLIPYFYYHPHHLSQWWRGWNMQAAFDHVGLFLRLGLPGMVMMTMEWWAFELLTLMAGVLPNAVVSVSAHAVLVNINNTIYMTFAGLAVASNIRVGNCLATFAITLYVLRGEIPSLFLNDAQGIARAASVLAVWAPLEVLDGLNAVVQGIFRGAGKQKVAATVNAVAYYVFGIPVAGLLGFHFLLGVEGLWLGFGFGIFIAASLQFYMLFERWTWEELADEAQKRTAE
ncbi:Multidrug/Oligosaccharidyl-lipid/Polysaccharide (MOP) Flippase transporter [Phytophthora megakarya]|uniref:Multidrug/Oligosaccharidyl-lipid/Polysaccharide (MOP) Flippase transporter n=1 Tax=Phytophthora megakarya TaxID=4795 RepID=A0A225V7G4_9STRA|nr:Multidrug/Oligosaccharidyl-lipid/Polysaccharide (MOP) Flippase transporter [Phytophthora megakarya]